jgi:hypothetical protein
LSIGARAGLCAELTEQAGRFLVHLVNYKSDSSAKNVVIRLRLTAGNRVRSVTLANPEQEHELPLPFDQQDDIVTFTVREVKVYQIAVVTMQQRSFSKTPGGQMPVSLKLVDPLM